MFPLCHFFKWCTKKLDALCQVGDYQVISTKGTFTRVYLDFKKNKAFYEIPVVFLMCV